MSAVKLDAFSGLRVVTPRVVLGAGLVVAGALLFARIGANHLVLLGVVGGLGLVSLLRASGRALGFGGAVIALMVACVALLPKRITVPLTPQVWGEAWDFSVLVSGSLCLLLAVHFLVKGRRLRATGMEVWFAALFAVAVLSLAVNINQFSDLDPAARGMVWLFAPMVILSLVANVRVTRRQRGLLLIFLMALGILLFAVGMLTSFRWWWVRLGPVGGLVFSPIQSAMGRTLSPLGGPNVLGLVFAMVTPVALVRMLGQPSPARKLFYLVIVTSLLAGVVLSLSRAAVGVAVTGLVFFGVLNRAVLGRHFVLVTTAALIVSAVVGGGVCAYRHRLNFARLTGLLAASERSQAASDALRLSSLEAALRVAQHHAVIGSGMGRWYPRQGSNVPIRIRGVVSAPEPHSLYLIALSELGLLGLGIVLVIMAKPACDFLGAYRRARDPEVRALLSAFATGAVMIALYSVTSSGIAHDHRFASFLWMFLGIGYQLVFAAKDRHSLGFRRVESSLRAGRGRAAESPVP